MTSHLMCAGCRGSTVLPDNAEALDPHGEETAEDADAVVLDMTDASETASPRPRLLLEWRLTEVNAPTTLRLQSQASTQTPRQKQCTLH